MDSFKSAIHLERNCQVLATNFLEQLLHEEEWDIYKSFTNVIRQRSFLTGRYCAKKAIAKFCQLPLHCICIHRGCFHQPIVLLPTEGNLGVSIAHVSSSAVAIAYQEGIPMGIDIELLNAETSETISKHLTAKELFMRDTLNVDKSLFNLICWSARESLSKALKTGLTTPFHLFEIEQLEKEDRWFRCGFSNFVQYVAFSKFINEMIVTVCLPKSVANETISLLTMQLQPNSLF